MKESKEDQILRLLKELVKVDRELETKIAEFKGAAKQKLVYVV